MSEEYNARFWIGGLMKTPIEEWTFGSDGAMKLAAKYRQLLWQLKE